MQLCGDLAGDAGLGERYLGILRNSAGKERSSPAGCFCMCMCATLNYSGLGAERSIE